MIRIRWALCLCLLGALCAQAQEKADSNPSQDGYQAIQAELTKTRADLANKYRSAAAEEKPAVLAEYQAVPQTFASKFLAYAADHPDSDDAVAALLAAMSNAGSEQEVANKAFAQLKANHAEDSALDSQLTALVNAATNGDIIAFVEQRLEKVTDASAKGQAMFALAQKLNGDAGREGSIEKSEKAEQLFKIIVEKYADVDAGRGKAGAQAEAALKQLGKFGVGKAAPEVEAEDLDGVSFKLSDYRGKVVLIDFWGNW